MGEGAWGVGRLMVALAAQSVLPHTMLSGEEHTGVPSQGATSRVPSHWLELFVVGTQVKTTVASQSVSAPQSAAGMVVAPRHVPSSWQVIGTAKLAQSASTQKSRPMDWGMNLSGSGDGEGGGSVGPEGVGGTGVGGGVGV